ncbi:hypothetical protein [Cryptosporangium phraense]|uniref:NurA domain-containing protein n=1 Tax=Cryptosporangium phraense TaxID=2593070 RepID=A0A545AVA4_9ACTN|nr:hypothetical protein [Cryptosporangium phraense]TQS45211.1 hypothetical protein FL583_08900 [Cryptosporangium phraense]
MPYVNESGNHERADRLNHRGLIVDPAVTAALKGMNLPDRAMARDRIQDDIGALRTSRLDLPLVGRATSRAVAVDGSPAEVEVLPDFPAARVGYLQVAVAHVDLNRMLAPPADRFVDPREIGRAAVGYVLKSVIPTSVINYRDGQDQPAAIRQAVDTIFRASRMGDSEDDLASLTDVLLHVWPGTPDAPAAFLEVRKCPSCGCEGPHRVGSAAISCPSCREPIYPTDVLQLHLEVAPEGSNLTVLGRLMNVVEVLVFLWFIRCFAQGSEYQHTAFILDGPLSVHGAAADLKRGAERFLQAVHETATRRGWKSPPILGLQKTGVLVDHAHQLASLDLLPPGTLVELPDGYLRRWVVPGPASAYGKDTDFGRRFLYRTQDGRVHVFAVPRLSGGTVTDDRLAVNRNAYPTLRTTVDLLDTVGTRLYEDAVIPVALAHNYASLPVGIGSEVLRTHAQVTLGIRPTALPPQPPRWPHR